MNESNMGVDPQQPKIEAENAPSGEEENHEVVADISKEQVEKKQNRILQEIIEVLKSHNIRVKSFDSPFTAYSAGYYNVRWDCDSDGEISRVKQTSQDGYSPDSMRKEYETVFFTEAANANYAVFGRSDTKDEVGEVESIAINTNINDKGYELFAISRTLTSLGKFGAKDEKIENLSKIVLEEISEIKKQREAEFSPILNKIKTDILPELHDEIFQYSVEHLKCKVPLHENLKNTLSAILGVFGARTAGIGTVETYSETLERATTDFIQNYYDKANLNQKLDRLNELVAQLQEQVSQFTEREEKIKQHELIVDFGGITRYHHYLVVSPLGDLVPPLEYRAKDARNNTDLWPELSNDHVMIAQPYKYTHPSHIYLPPNITPEQIKSIQEFEKKLGLEKGYFKEPYDLDPETKELIDQVEHELKIFTASLPDKLKPEKNIELKTDFDLSCLSSPKSINIRYLDNNVGQYVRSGLPFTETINNRESQVIFKKDTQVGKFQVMAYRWGGEWNADIQFVREDNTETQQEQNEQPSGTTWEDLKKKWNS